MIIGIGLDIVELDRISEVLNRNPKFINRILTEKEKEYYYRLSNKRKIEFLAGRFAAKEAFSKAIGTGIGQKVSFLDIEVLYNESGKPIVIQEVITSHVHVSITHSKQFAAAQVIIESLDS